MTNELIELLLKTSCCFCKRHDQIGKKRSRAPTREADDTPLAKLRGKTAVSSLAALHTAPIFITMLVNPPGWRPICPPARFIYPPACCIWLFDSSARCTGLLALCICLLPFQLCSSLSMPTPAVQESSSDTFSQRHEPFLQSWEMNVSFTSKSKSPRSFLSRDNGGVLASRTQPQIAKKKKVTNNTQTESIQIHNH